VRLLDVVQHARNDRARRIAIEESVGKPLQMCEQFALQFEYQPIAGDSGPVVAEVAGQGLQRVEQQ